MISEISFKAYCSLCSADLLSGKTGCNTAIAYYTLGIMQKLLQ